MGYRDLPQPFALHQLRAAGVTRDELRALLDAGGVRRVLQGVYVDAAFPDSVELRAAALAVVVSPEAVVCRRTAAWLFTVDVRAPGAHLDVPPIELLVPAGVAVIRRAHVRGYVCDDLEPGDVVVVHGLRVTSPLRTAVDLARWLPRVEALVAVDALTHACLVTLPELVAALPRWDGRRGIRQAREVVELAEPRTESAGESRTRLRIIDAGFPRPEAQIEVFDLGVLVYRIDMGYRKRLIGVEYDGEADHTSAEDLAYDARRRGWLERQGWQLLVVGRREVFGRGYALEWALGDLLGVAPRLPAGALTRGPWG